MLPIVSRTISQHCSMHLGETVAVKKMKKKFYSWEECITLREIKALKLLSHSNIIKLKEVVRESNDLYFVFEHLDNNLYEEIRYRQERCRSYTEQEVKSIMIQIFEGLSYMHKHGFFHRDIKPENLLCRASGVASSSASVFDARTSLERGIPRDCGLIVKLADFGLAREIRSLPPYTEYVSTRWYRAPELLLHSKTYNSPVDIWACGCIFAELCTFQPLFPGKNETDQLMKICSILGSPTKLAVQEENEWTEGLRLSQKVSFLWPEFNKRSLERIICGKNSHLTFDSIRFLQSMLKFDPQKRPTALQVLNTDYLLRACSPLEEANPVKVLGLGKSFDNLASSVQLETSHFQDQPAAHRTEAMYSTPGEEEHHDYDKSFIGMPEPLPSLNLQWQADQFTTKTNQREEERDNNWSKWRSEEPTVARTFLDRLNAAEDLIIQTETLEGGYAPGNDVNDLLNNIEATYYSASSPSEKLVTKEHTVANVMQYHESETCDLQADVFNQASSDNVQAEELVSSSCNVATGFDQFRPDENKNTVLLKRGASDSLRHAITREEQDAQRSERKLCTRDYTHLQQTEERPFAIRKLRFSSTNRNDPAGESSCHMERSAADRPTDRRVMANSGYFSHFGFQSLCHLPQFPSSKKRSPKRLKKIGAKEEWKEQSSASSRKQRTRKPWPNLFSFGLS